jgi:hypothetical protein
MDEFSQSMTVARRCAARFGMHVFCVVRRIGGRNSHPDFHRVQSNKILITTIEDVAQL